MIAGHDSGLALNALDFLKTRTFAWDIQGFGRDNSPHFGSIILHFLDYLWSFFSGVSYAGNQITLFFWISAIFTSSFIFSYQLRKKLGQYFVFLFPVFVTFNFYILQSIFIIERAKYSLLVATLLFLTIVFKFQEKKLSVLWAGILSALVLFLFNSGSWLGLPLYGSFFVFVLSLVLFEILRAVKKRKYSELVRLLMLLMATAVGAMILNAYSIFPYVATFLKQDIYAITNEGVIAQNKAWLEMISQASSFLNIFRLQGVPDWYSGSTGVNLAHSYASDYLTNKGLITASFVFPTLIFSSLFIAEKKEEKKLISFFGLAALIALFFMAGSHKPLGFLYELLYENVPGFSIFRSPYYKFGAAFFLSVSVLLSFTLSATIERITKKFQIKNKALTGFVLTLFATVLWFGYHSVIFNPKDIFSWQKGLSTKFEVPEYVYAFGEWTKEANLGDSRILLVPPINELWKNDAYTWGYWSLTNLPSTISSQSIVTNENLPEEQKAWVNRLYYLIGEGREEEVLDLSSKLGIDYLLFREDVLSDASWSAASSPEEFEKILQNFRSLQKIETFDKWVVYKFDRESTPKFSVISSLTTIPEKHSYLAREFLKDESSVYSNGDQITPFISSELAVFDCQSCPLEGKDALTRLPEVKILSNSPLYFLKEKREENVLKVAETEQAKMDAYLGFSVRRAAEVKTMLDFGLDDRYSAEALKTMNLYLEELYKLFEASTDSDKYYFRARRLTDNINIIDASFKGYVSKDDFGKRDENLRQGILDVLWNIKQLKGLFPIINDKNKLETEKVYYLDFSKEGDREFYFDPSTFPINNLGQVVFPTDISYRVQDKTVSIPLEKGVDNWHKFQIPAGLENGKLTLKFPRFPNLLEITGSSTEYSPMGERACYIGKIANYSSTKVYRVEIENNIKGQALRVFFKDAEMQSGTNEFIGGQDVVDIGQTSPAHPFHHLYYPSAGSTDSTIYLCSDNGELPVVDRVEFHEIVSPNIVSVRQISQSLGGNATVNYEKINPTHYLVSIKKADTPFILSFNESFSPFWRIRDFDVEHFMVDGYANAWIIDKEGSYDLVIEYLPQKLFYYGIGISILGLGLVGGIYLKNRTKS